MGGRTTPHRRQSLSGGGPIDASSSWARRRRSAGPTRWIPAFAGMTFVYCGLEEIDRASFSPPELLQNFIEVLSHTLRGSP
jgi:hypothetical protein